MQGAKQGRSCLRLGHLVGVLPGMSISSLERGPCCGGRRPLLSPSRTPRSRSAGERRGKWCGDRCGIVADDESPRLLAGRRSWQLHWFALVVIDERFTQRDPATPPPIDRRLHGDRWPTILSGHRRATRQRLRRTNPPPSSNRMVPAATPCNALGPVRWRAPKVAPVPTGPTPLEAGPVPAPPEPGRKPVPPF